MEVTSSVNINNKEEVEIGEKSLGMLEEDRSLVLSELDLDNKKIEASVLENGATEKDYLQEPNSRSQTSRSQTSRSQTSRSQN